MTRKVFLDSGIFIAFLDRRDRQHRPALDLFRNPPAHWITSPFVIAEAYGWFLHRLGEDKARTFREFFHKLEGLKILDTDPRHLDRAEEKLDLHRGLKLTFVDASSLAWLEDRNISTVWGTDHDLAIEGTKVIPGPPG